MAERGFTLVEMLLSLGIIALLTGLSVPVYNTFLARNDLDITTQGIVAALRRAQTYSRAVEGDSQWGVAVVSGKAVLFKGATYAARDTAFDETTTIAANVTTSGLSEITFAKLTAAPSTTGTTTLSTVNETRTVTINAEGMVE
jgi:prepilin-type N-terminal cleavage/methylation domain-containing protein